MPDKNRRNFKARATIICLRSGKVLLVRKKSGKWNFPGGTIEAGEQPVEAAARELQEETRLRSIGLLELCTLEVDGLLHYIFTAHLADDSDAKADNEIFACKWVRRDQLTGTVLTPGATALMRRQIPALSS